MGSAARKLHHLCSFQLNWFQAGIFKQPEAAAKQHWHDVNVQLIYETCSDR
jgi:hypothetical protein